MCEKEREIIKAWNDKYVGHVISVLDVGSRDINGNVRDIFKSLGYIGIDMIAGDNVNIVLRGDEINTRNDWSERFGLVLCLNTLEHDSNFLETISQMQWATKKGGLMIVSTPTFGFPIHRHLRDYWRFGEDAYREIIFKGFDILELQEFYTKPGNINPCIIAIGRKL